MDKILLSTLFALIAGFLTAVISFVKLVNDKESKVTDFRQMWTSTVRTSLADLISNIEALMELYVVRANQINRCNELSIEFQNAADDHEKKIKEFALKHHEAVLDTVKSDVIETRNKVYTSFNITRLHFKPEDLEFQAIENKFELIHSASQNIDNIDYDKEQIIKIKLQVKNYCSDIANSSRYILKREWEKIKVGEVSFQKSKKWAKTGGMLLLIVLFVFATHALIAFYRGGSLVVDKSQKPAIEAPA